MSAAKFAAYDNFHIDFVHYDRQKRPPLEHYHDTFELLLYTRAHVEIFVEGRKHLVQDGDMLLISPFDIHRVLYNPDHEYSRYHIQFSHGFLKEIFAVLFPCDILLKLQDNYKKLVRLTFRERNEVEARFRSLLSFYGDLRQAPQDRHIQAAIKLELASLVLQYFRMVEKERQRRPIQRGQDHIQQWTRYLDEHCREPVKLEDLARQFGKSKYYISHEFKKHTRLTIIEYLQFRRVAEARKKLINTSEPIADIALQTGFSSTQHFYRVFKKITKKTPAQYRFEFGELEKTQ